MNKVFVDKYLGVAAVAESATDAVTLLAHHFQFPRDQFHVAELNTDTPGIVDLGNIWEIVKARKSAAKNGYYDKHLDDMKPLPNQYGETLWSDHQ